MPDISIVIVNYNTRDDLQACLDSIIAHRGSLNTEIIVVDNGSRDGSREMVRQYADEVILIAPDENTWFTGGNNLGVQRATAPYVWILNPDTILQPDTLPRMVDYLRQHDDVGALTCRMVYPDGRLQRTCSRVPHYVDLLLDYTALGVLLAGWRNRRRQRMWYSDWQRDSDKAVEVAPGSNLMAPRHLLNELGTFDDALRLYFPEDDLCYRIREAGYRVQFIADVTLLHKEHASVAQVQRLASQTYFRDLLVFCRKYHGLPRTLFLQALMIPTRWAMDMAQRLRGERRAL